MTLGKSECIHWIGGSNFDMRSVYSEASLPLATTTTRSESRTLTKVKTKHSAKVNYPKVFHQDDFLE